MSTSTGYGSPNSTKRHVFDSDNDDYELWEVKFKAMLRLNKLYSILNKSAPTDPADLAVYDEKNAEIFSTLVLWLDDKSISLIVRDAPDDGKAALEISR